MTESRRLEATHRVLNDLLALTWDQARGSSVARDALIVLGANARADPSLPLTVLFADQARGAAARHGDLTLADLGIEEDHP